MDVSPNALSEFIATHGAWVTIAVAEALFLWNRIRRLDQITDGYHAAMVATTAALTAMEALIRDRGGKS
jgi:hypothetical protein